MKKLLFEDLKPDPLEQFSLWFDEARKTHGIRDPNACCLSTLDPEGYPEGRMVLLKDFNAEGFTFYTNSLSRKGKSLSLYPKAALTFYWDSLQRQVRIQGDAQVVTKAEADAYFATRPREAQIGAWASKQSQPLASRETLEASLVELEAKFESQNVPRPEHWTGYRILAVTIEFWQERPARLHDRFRYIRLSDAWHLNRLYP